MPMENPPDLVKLVNNETEFHPFTHNNIYTSTDIKSSSQLLPGCKKEDGFKSGIRYKYKI